MTVQQETATATASTNNVEDMTPDSTDQLHAEQPSQEQQQQQEAFDPETGEINWDCSCLGTMTQPPCGEKFKSAFSCFVYSKEEPKGLDCVELLRQMQLCFKEHPEIYGEEEAHDDDEEDEADSDDSSISDSDLDSDSDFDVDTE
ncbi:Oxidoreductase [Chytriomyces hyalinus]|nr:Oxidoreductase [Chytriomyces hyalinus]